MTPPYRFGIMGHNIGYTLSPRIFSAIYDIEGTAGTFSVMDVAPAEFEKGLDELRSWQGFSVTTPYKEMLIPYVAWLAPEAEGIGAVNSVRVEGGKFHGYNTDAEAFMAPLRRMSFDGRKVLVLGHGGAARAVLWALVNDFQGLEIHVCGRDGSRVGRFVGEQMSVLGEKATVDSMTGGDLEIDAKYDLIVNCTPVGGRIYPDKSPIAEDFMYSGSPVCYDLIYSPARTAFLTQAAQAGCRVVNGMQMLVRQAVASYNIWAGRDLDPDFVGERILKLLDNEDKGKV